MTDRDDQRSDAMNDLRYPIGELELAGPLTPPERLACIDRIEQTPQRLRAAVDGLDDAQLDTPYRPDGWTVRQVVHHLPDSHLSSYLRLKMALTEDTPTISTYDEARWAALADSRAPIAMSLDLLTALHERWVLLLRSLDDQQWRRRLRHPDLGEMGVDELAALYAWHGPHHVAHITALRERMAW